VIKNSFPKIVKDIVKGLPKSNYSVLNKRHSDLIIGLNSRI